MRVPAKWLRSYCNPELSNEELADRLSFSGLELERLERVGLPSTDAFVVGKVVEAKQHPDADRLTVCKVNDGLPELRTIVCGAPNVAAGQTVAVARPGATMPDGTELGEATLRGVKSSGMILAEDEVGLGENHAGIMVLADDAPAGAPLADHLPIADEVLELETSPNRPDTLAVYGVAREVHAITAAPLARDPTLTDAEATGDGRAEDYASVEIDPEICLRFTARVFEDVHIDESPLWLKQRLIAAGQRPISNVVDIPNYVMLTCGQPLHAYDLDEVRGGQLIVRRARDGEPITTLDGVERRLDSEITLVCDAEGPSGIAGVMGGQISEVSDKTSRVLMEAATWVGPNILRTSAALGLRTEASARFEKQLHPDNAMAAQRLAARLMVSLCHARLVPGTIDVYPRPAKPRRVPLRLERLSKLLGEDIPPDQVGAILGRLGFDVKAVDGRLSVGVPYWRDSDVQREADLVEEVARIHGLDKLPTTLPARRQAVGRLTPGQRLRRRVEDSLRDRGLSEVVAFSFTSPETIAALRLEANALLRLANPLSADQSVMRSLLLPGLLDSVRHNAAHGRPAAALFESAHVYERSGPLDEVPKPPRGAKPATERHHIGAVLSGELTSGWRSRGREVDFYVAKALLGTTLAPSGVDWKVEPGTRPFLHPGRSAVVVGPFRRELGWIGELHPLVARRWELDGPVACFEIDFDALAALVPEAVAYRDVTSFPAVLQDIAVVVPEEATAAQVEKAVRNGAGELLAGLRVFDLYHGEQVGEGRKSLALRLEFRAPDRTLTDEEVAGRRAAIEAALEEIGGRLRG
jgi:phenylalanyl-tRNA synthetase beta chain